MDSVILINEKDILLSVPFVPRRVRVWWQSSDNTDDDATHGMWWPATAKSVYSDSCDTPENPLINNYRIEVKYDNSEVSSCALHELEPLDPPNVYGRADSLGLLHKGEFCEFFNGSESDPAHIVGLVEEVIRPRRTYIIRKVFSRCGLQEEPEMVAFESCRRARIFDRSSMRWNYIRPNQVWKFMDIVSPRQLIQLTESQFTAVLPFINSLPVLKHSKEVVREISFGMPRKIQLMGNGMKNEKYSDVAAEDKGKIGKIYKAMGEETEESIFEHPKYAVGSVTQLINPNTDVYEEESDPDCQNATICLETEKETDSLVTPAIYKEKLAPEFASNLPLTIREYLKRKPNSDKEVDDCEKEEGREIIDTCSSTLPLSYFKEVVPTSPKPDFSLRVENAVANFNFTQLIKEDDIPKIKSAEIVEESSDFAISDTEEIVFNKKAGRPIRKKDLPSYAKVRRRFEHLILRAPDRCGDVAVLDEKPAVCEPMSEDILKRTKPELLAFAENLMQNVICSMKDQAVAQLSKFDEKVSSVAPLPPFAFNSSSEVRSRLRLVPSSALVDPCSEQAFMDARCYPLKGSSMGISSLRRPPVGEENTTEGDILMTLTPYRLAQTICNLTSQETEMIVAWKGSKSKLSRAQSYAQQHVQHANQQDTASGYPLSRQESAVRPNPGGRRRRTAAALLEPSFDNVTSQQYHHHVANAVQSEIDSDLEDAIQFSLEQGSRRRRHRGSGVELDDKPWELLNSKKRRVHSRTQIGGTVTKNEKDLTNPSTHATNVVGLGVGGFAGDVTTVATNHEMMRPSRAFGELDVHHHNNQIQQHLQQQIQQQQLQQLQQQHQQQQFLQQLPHPSGLLHAQQHVAAAIHGNWGVDKQLLEDPIRSRSIPSDVSDLVNLKVGHNPVVHYYNGDWLVQQELPKDLATNDGKGFKVSNPFHPFRNQIVAIYSKLQAANPAPGAELESNNPSLTGAIINTSATPNIPSNVQSLATQQLQEHQNIGGMASIFPPRLPTQEVLPQATGSISTFTGPSGIIPTLTPSVSTLNSTALPSNIDTSLTRRSQSNILTPQPSSLLPHQHQLGGQVLIKPNAVPTIGDFLGIPAFGNECLGVPSGIMLATIPDDNIEAGKTSSTNGLPVESQLKYLSMLQQKLRSPLLPGTPNYELKLNTLIMTPLLRLLFHISPVTVTNVLNQVPRYVLNRLALFLLHAFTFPSALPVAHLASLIRQHLLFAIPDGSSACITTPEALSAIESELMTAASVAFVGIDSSPGYLLSLYIPASERSKKTVPRHPLLLEAVNQQLTNSTQKSSIPYSPASYGACVETLNSPPPVVPHKVYSSRFQPRWHVRGEAPKLPVIGLEEFLVAECSPLPCYEFHVGPYAVIPLSFLEPTIALLGPQETLNLLVSFNRLVIGCTDATATTCFPGAFLSLHHVSVLKAHSDASVHYLATLYNSPFVVSTLNQVNQHQRILALQTLLPVSTTTSPSTGNTTGTSGISSGTSVITGVSGANSSNLTKALGKVDFVKNEASAPTPIPGLNFANLTPNPTGPNTLISAVQPVSSKNIGNEWSMPMNPLLNTNMMNPNINLSLGSSSASAEDPNAATANALRYQLQFLQQQQRILQQQIMISSNAAAATSAQYSDLTTKIESNSSNTPIPATQNPVTHGVNLVIPNAQNFTGTVPTTFAYNKSNLNSTVCGPNMTMPQVGSSETVPPSANASKKLTGDINELPPYSVSLMKKAMDDMKRQKDLKGMANKDEHITSDALAANSSQSLSNSGALSSSLDQNILSSKSNKAEMDVDEVSSSDNKNKINN